MAAKIDRNATTPARMRRNWQRLASGGATQNVLVNAPLAISAGKIGLTIDANGGLENVSSALRAKLADTSLSRVAAGLSVALAVNSGLTVAAGLKLLLADTSLALAAGGVSANLAASGGLQTNAGLLVRGLRVVAADPGGPSDGDNWYNSTDKAPRVTAAGKVATVPYCPFVNTASSTAIANSVAQTTFSTKWTSATGFIGLVGRAVKISASGRYSTTGTPTLNLAIAIGTGVIMNVALVTTSGAANALWFYETEFVITATGVAGTLNATGSATVTATATFLGASGAAVDTTQANPDIGVTAKWGTASASNTVTCDYLAVTVLR